LRRPRSRGIILEAHRGKDPDQFLAIARVTRPQGRKGEVAAEVLTDFPERFEALGQAYLENPGSPPESIVLEGCRFHKNRVILKFQGVDSIDQAERLRGRHLLIPRQEKTPLPEHHYYVWELKGCRVLREHQGRLDEVGTVTDVDTTGGVDVLRVELKSLETERGLDAGREGPRGRPREALIPLAQAICKRIDTEAKIIVIDPPEDLLDLNL